MGVGTLGTSGALMVLAYGKGYLGFKMSCFSYLTSCHLMSKPSHVRSLRVLATCSKRFMKTRLLELSSVVV